LKLDRSEKHISIDMKIALKFHRISFMDYVSIPALGLLKTLLFQF
jgi:hypothetical protein